MPIDIRDAIAARRESSRKRADAALAVLRDRFLPFQAAFMERLSRIMHGRQRKAIRLRLVNDLLSEVRDLSSDLVACRKGCAHCCHLRVVMHSAEAEAIGERIGVAPVGLAEGHAMADALGFGAHTPCPFLRDGQCSIYDDRPFVCRSHVNLDEDELLCRFENIEMARERDPRAVEIPTIDAGILQSLYSGLGSGGRLGDIRDFFPHGLAGAAGSGRRGD